MLITIFYFLIYNSLRNQISKYIWDIYKVSGIWGKYEIICIVLNFDIQASITCQIQYITLIAPLKLTTNSGHQVCMGVWGVGVFMGGMQRYHRCRREKNKHLLSGWSDEEGESEKESKGSLLLMNIRKTFQISLSHFLLLLISHKWSSFWHTLNHRTFHDIRHALKIFHISKISAEPGGGRIHQCQV